MPHERTLVMIKPNAVSKNVIGPIIGKLEAGGLRVAAARLEHLSREQCENFYAEHKGKPFYEGLVEFMNSSPAMLLVLAGEDAIPKAREIMGATDPAQAAPGTIRAEFADDVTRNAVHGSDSPVSAEREVSFFFTEEDICND